ncbi:WD40-repeat-containing domain protein [Dactylonectria macrodidyma]|uniref:WD40-repeat-containing domain protein n=1 Tax=Dactylonectria macrodidyma TaxID=307937 RepID=A0A9P9ENJ0_9HYPO|nr:WD40-repeat-containing domain protein [Dactylonectria macrodidyma]
MDEECMRHLHVINPETHKKEIEKTKGGLLKDSYDWILNHEDFQQFRNDPERRLLWIKGDPGKGKTMLLCGIIDELSKEPSRLTSFYFCQATDTKLRKATSVVRGLIWLLCKKKPELISCVRAKYDIEGEKIFDGFCALESLKEILTNMIEHKTMQNAVLIVDALDECAEDDRRDLISLILKLSSMSPANWIVSSRNWPAIEEQFLLTSNVRIVLELNKDAISEAVKMYIQKKVDELGFKKRYDVATKQAVFETLLVKSENTFLWVGLACRELSEVSLRHTMAKLSSVPRGMNQMYERMLEKIWHSDDRDICRDLLATACIAYRPVTMDELCVLAPDLKDFDSEVLEEIVKECGSFLALENRVINFVHQTAKDFLMRKAEQVFRFDITHHHRTLFQRSMEALIGLKRNIYDLKHVGILLEEVVFPDPDPLSHLRYSALYWIDHLEQVGERKLSDDEAVDRFIRKKFLTWLEAMSLQSKMPEAAKALVKLGEIIRNTLVRGLEDLVEDGQRFALTHRPGIEIAPLQVYASALLFSPTNSLIRKLFEEDELDWIAIKPQMDENWDACIQTLECGITAKSLAISSDGRRLATGNDRYLGFWDMHPSECVGSLNLSEHFDNASITSIALSKDGNRAVVAVFVYEKEKDDQEDEEENFEIGIWDVGAEQFSHWLRGHQGIVEDAHFSPDGKLIATCSNDKTIKIWDAVVLRCIRTLYGHDSDVESLSFSGDGAQLASHSHDKTVKVWDVATGTCTWTLQSLGGNGSWVTQMRPVVFIEAGLLASAAGYDIKIWNAATGICVQTIRDSTDGGVYSIIALGGGRLFASTTNNGKIKVWDIEGVCIQTFLVHNNWPTAVVAISSGDLLASGSGQGTVKFWDMKQMLSAQKIENHSPSYCVKFSPNGQCLVSRGRMKLNISDARNGTHISAIKNPLADTRFHTPTFSPDGRWLLDCQISTTLNVWNMANLTLTLSLHCIGQWNNPHAVFSYDGRLIAVRSNKKSIEVWEIETRTHIQTFFIMATGMVFSFDSKHLAFATSEQVQIWDISKGTLIQIFQHGTPGSRSTLSMNADSLAMLGIEIILEPPRSSMLSNVTINAWKLDTGTSLRYIRRSHVSSLKTPSMALSRNGKWLVAGISRELIVWNVDTGTLMLSVDVPPDILWFRFDEAKSSKLHTPFGIIDLDISLASGTWANGMPQRFDYGGYSCEDPWILRGSERVLWLPPEFRKGDARRWKSAIDVMGSAVAISPESTGREFMIRFKPEDLSPIEPRVSRSGSRF